MSAPDLTDSELVDLYWRTTGDNWAIPDDVMVRYGRAVLTAAAPLIAQQVREQAAQEIEAYADATWDLIDSNNGARLAFEEIARIAREGDR